MDESLFLFLAIDEKELTEIYPWTMTLVHNLPRFGYSNRVWGEHSKGYKQGISAVATWEALRILVIAFLTGRLTLKYGFDTLYTRFHLVIPVCLSALFGALLCEWARVSDLMTKASVQGYELTFFRLEIEKGAYIDEWYKSVINTTDEIEILMRESYRGKTPDAGKAVLLQDFEIDIGYADLLAHREIVKLIEYGRSLHHHDPNRKYSIICPRRTINHQYEEVLKNNIKGKILFLLIILVILKMCGVTAMCACMGVLGCHLIIIVVMKNMLTYSDSCFGVRVEHEILHKNPSMDLIIENNTMAFNYSIPQRIKRFDQFIMSKQLPETENISFYNISMMEFNTSEVNETTTTPTIIEEIVEKPRPEDQDYFWFEKVCRKWSKEYETKLLKYYAMFDKASAAINERSYSVSPNDFDELNVSERQQLFLFFIKDIIDNCKLKLDNIKKPHSGHLCQPFEFGGGNVTSYVNDLVCRTPYYITLFVIEYLIMSSVFLATVLLLVCVKETDVVCTSECSKYMRELERKDTTCFECICNTLYCCFRWLACCCVYEAVVLDYVPEPCRRDGTCNPDNPCLPGQVCDQYPDCPGLDVKNKIPVDQEEEAED